MEASRSVWVLGLGREEVLGNRVVSHCEILLNGPPF